MKREEQERWIRMIQQRMPGASLRCPLCGNAQFTLLDKYLNPAVMDVIEPVLMVGGPTLPLLVAVCNRCGWTAQFAAKILDPDFSVHPGPASGSEEVKEANG